MGGLVEFIEITQQVNFLGIGHPLSDDHEVGRREGQAKVFAAVIHSPVERILLDEVITVVVDGLRCPSDALDKIMSTSRSSGWQRTVAQDSI